MRGFDRAEQRLLTNDSFLGPELWFGYDVFRCDWAYYNFTYIVVYPQSEEARVRQIIGGAWEPAVMWEDLRVAMRERVTAQPDDALAWYGLDETLLQQGKPAEAIEAYERVITTGLPDRYLWYRYGYWKALNQIGAYEKVLSTSQPVLVAMEMSEDIRYQRAITLRNLDRSEDARAELEQALGDNPNFAPVSVLLEELAQSSTSETGG